MEDLGLTWLPDCVGRRDSDALENTNMKTLEVTRTIKGLEPYKAPGPDGISPAVLNERAETLDGKLGMLFKISYGKESVPAERERSNLRANF